MLFLFPRAMSQVSCFKPTFGWFEHIDECREGPGLTIIGLFSKKEDLYETKKISRSA